MVQNKVIKLQLLIIYIICIKYWSYKIIQLQQLLPITGQHKTKERKKRQKEVGKTTNTPPAVNRTIQNTKLKLTTEISKPNNQTGRFF